MDPKDWTWRTINPAARRLVEKVLSEKGMLHLKVVARSLHGDQSFDMGIHLITDDDQFHGLCRWATENHNLYNRGVHVHDLSDWRIMIECYSIEPLLPHEGAEWDDEPVFMQAMETRPGVFADPNTPRSDT